MGIIKKIIDRELVGGTTDEEVYPISSTKAIYDTENHTLEYILSKIKSRINEVSARHGYYVCSTISSEPDKEIEVPNFELSTNIRLLVKMGYSNTVDNVSFEVNNTGAYPLYYNNSPASKFNSWIEGEILDIYFDGASFKAFSSKSESTDSPWTLKVDSNGKQYVYTSLPIVGKEGLTIYSTNDVVVPSTFDGLPIDNDTIYWDESTGVKILKAKGGNNFDSSRMWSLLAESTTEQINKSHLTNALIDYATISQLNTKWTQDDTKISNWNEAYNLRHSHSNKSVLDGITSGKVSNWDTAYSWGNHASAGYAHLAGEETFSGLKHFTNGLTVGAGKHKIYEENGIIYLDGDLAVKGGVTAYAVSESEISTVMDGVAVDGVTIKKENGVLVAIAGSGSSFDKSAMWAALLASTDEQINKSHLTTALTGYATESWVTGKNYAVKATTLAGYGITDAYTKTEADNKYLLKTSYTAADVLSKLLTVDGSSSGLDADLLDGKQGDDYLYHVRQTETDANSISTSDPRVYEISSGTNMPTSNTWHQIFNWGSGDGGYGCQLANLYTVKNSFLYYRIKVANSWGSWYTLARTIDNVASATKLQTPRTLWGQSFDGTSNVSGSLTGVDKIYANYIELKDSGTGGFNTIARLLNSNITNGNVVNVEIGHDSTSKNLGYIGFGYYGNGDTRNFLTFGIHSVDKILNITGSGNVGIGTTSPSYKLHVNGSAHSTDLYIDGIRIHKTQDGVLKLEGSLLVSGGITAYSTGEESGGSSGGLDVDLLWEILGGTGTQQINKTHLTDALNGYATQSWVTSQNYLKSVSISTISDLNSSWDALLKTAPSSYVTRWPSFSEITSKPTTLSGYGITDSYTKTETDNRYVTITRKYSITTTGTAPYNYVHLCKIANTSGYSHLRLDIDIKSRYSGATLYVDLEVGSPTTNCTPHIYKSTFGARACTLYYTKTTEGNYVYIDIYFKSGAWDVVSYDIISKGTNGTLSFTHVGEKLDSLPSGYIEISERGFNGNSASATKLQTPRTLWGNSFDGSANVNGNMTDVGSISANGDIVLNQNGSTGIRQVRIQCGDNDYGRIAAGATAANAGWLEIASADDGNEPIYVRQYTGTFTTLKRTATLLDSNGNTSFPGSITSASFKKSGSSDSYVLLGGGGHKALSDIQSEYDSRYVNVSGDTMTGTLNVIGKVNTVLDTPSIRFYQDSCKIGTDIEGSLGIYAENKIVLRPNSKSSNSGKGIDIYDSYVTYNGNKIWHAGNDGSGSGLDADTLDGKHNGEINGFLNTIMLPSTNNDKTNWWCKIATIKITSQYSSKEALLLITDNYTTSGTSVYCFVYIKVQQQASMGNMPNISLRMFGSVGKSNIEGRLTLSSTSSTLDLYFKETLAYQRSRISFVQGSEDIRNVGELIQTLPTATHNISCDNDFRAGKLEVPRTIWGQNFDGTANVSGSLTGVSTITANGESKFSNGTYSDPAKGIVCALKISQNFAAGSNCYLATLGGKVGIGTTTPLNLLDVYGGNISSRSGKGGYVIYPGYKSDESFRLECLNSSGSWVHNGMVMLQNGNIGIGTLSPSEKLHVSGNILATGGITCYSSDERAKTIIEEISLSLKQISESPTIRFKWNGWNIKDDGKTHIGGIAQYVQNLLPECILDADGVLNMDYATTAYIYSVQTAKHLQTYETKTDKKIRRLEKEIVYLKQQLKKLGYEESDTLVN